MLLKKAEAEGRVEEGAGRAEGREPVWAGVVSTALHDDEGRLRASE